MWEICRTPGAPTRRKPQFNHCDWGIMPSPKAESISHLMWTHMMQETSSPSYPYLASQGYLMPFAIPTTYAVPMQYAFPKSHPPSMSQVSMKSEPTLITNKQCLCCVCWKGEYKEFCRKGKAEEHLNKQYLSWFSPGAAIPCPDEYCKHALIWGSDHFKRHEQEVHRAPRSVSLPLQTHSCCLIVSRLSRSRVGLPCSSLNLSLRLSTIEEGIRW